MMAVSVYLPRRLQQAPFEEYVRGLGGKWQPIEGGMSAYVGREAADVYIRVYDRFFDTDDPEELRRMAEIGGHLGTPVVDGVLIEVGHAPKSAALAHAIALEVARRLSGWVDDEELLSELRAAASEPPPGRS